MMAGSAEEIRSGFCRVLGLAVAEPRLIQNRAGLMRKRELRTMTGDRRPAPHTQCKWVRASTASRVSASQMRGHAIHLLGDWQEPPKRPSPKAGVARGLGRVGNVFSRKGIHYTHTGISGQFFAFPPEPQHPATPFSSEFGSECIAETYFICIIPSRSLNSSRHETWTEMFRIRISLLYRCAPCSLPRQQVPGPSNDWAVTHGSCPCRISPSPPAAAFEPSEPCWHREPQTGIDCVSQSQSGRANFPCRE
jgi:hypothetical protein